MKLLVLGGTLFLSRAVAIEALQHGHEVICAARGKSGNPSAGAKLIHVDRDAPSSLDSLAQRFDAVADVARMSYPWVAEALKVLADRTAHWTFVSTINVYSDEATPGQRADAPLREPITSTAQPPTPDDYGGVKVASENAVRAAPALAAGLRVRPLADTIHATLETERELGLNRQRTAGLTPEEEAELLRITS